MATVRPSTQPSSRSRPTNAAVHLLMADCESWPRNPMVGTLATCCALAANDQVSVAPPTASMNSRRRIECPAKNRLIDVRSLAALQAAKVRKRKCPRWVKRRHLLTTGQGLLHPQERTSGGPDGMSVRCPITDVGRLLFDHLVGPGKQARWDGESEFSRRL